MKFSFKFSNLLGTVYRKGNLVFSADGNSVYSPVGNKITIYDLKNNKTQTLGFSSQYNYEAIDISPNGLLLACVDERGEAHIISMMSKTIIFKYRFQRNVPVIKFSPDGQYLAALKDNGVFILKIPGSILTTYKGFELVKVFNYALDRTTCLDWTSDSKFLAVGSADAATRIFPILNIPKFTSYCLGSHKNSIVACFFEKDSLDMISLSCDGILCLWECNSDLEDLNLQFSPPKKSKPLQDDDYTEGEVENSSFQIDLQDEEAVETLEKNVENEKDDLTSDNKVFYKRISKQNICSSLKKNNSGVRISSACYHKSTHILVAGYSTGDFVLYELPSVTMIHSLSICEHEINSITFNVSGDWIALASATLGNLLVWEWQSETYVMKQQGHINNMLCLSYSSDGLLIATGGCDGKVKLWNTVTGFCFVTFTEHSSNVTALQFSQSKSFVASASLDGTVRAFDLIRYRNFKTFTSPIPAQFSCIAIDSNGEFIAAGSQDRFEIYLWSLKIGRLCEILTGHEGPVVGLSFNPVLGSTTLASVSWDKTMRLWNAVDTKNENEVFLLSSDGLSVAFRPDGKEVAVSSLDGQIAFFDIKNRVQTKFIEGRYDLGSGVADTDIISAKKNLSTKAFTTMCYTADGSCILAGGQSKNVCLYNIEESILLKKFEITINKSLDNVEEFINRRKITEFGNMALIEKRVNDSVQIRLPGVRQGDLASRALKPEIRVFCLEFSPTGQAWAATTTEGLLIYSLEMTLVFEPLELSIGITLETVRITLQQEDYSKALMMAIKLGEKLLIRHVIESVPFSHIKLCVVSISKTYIIRCLKFIASFLESSKHIEFYLTWIRHILTIHGSTVKGPEFIPVLLSLQKNLSKSFDQLSKLCDHNKYTIEFLVKIGKIKNEKKHSKVCNANDEEKFDLMGS